MAIYPRLVNVVDRFPVHASALVAGEPVLFPEVRLLVAGREARLLGMKGGRPTVLHAATLTDPLPAPTREIRSLQTVDGEWRLDRSPGCGCHHPLKRLARQDALVAAGLA